MSDLLTSITARLSGIADSIARPLLAVIGILPGWVSATLISIVTGTLLLIAFKYTSHQRGIKNARDQIKANLLSIRLFNDTPAVAMVAQVRILRAAGKLLLLSLVPAVIMSVPVCLLLAQLSQWYQYRPLRVGEEAVVTLYLDAAKPVPHVEIKPSAAVEVELGPVRAQSRGFVCWNVRARQAGYQELVFESGGTRASKQLAIGDAFMRVSPRRPAWRAADVLFNPLEQPFASTSEIQAIEINYPERNSWTSGTNTWVFYWCGVSMIAGFALRRVFNVSL